MKNIGNIAGKLVAFAFEIHENDVTAWSRLLAALTAVLLFSLITIIFGTFFYAIFK